VLRRVTGDLPGVPSAGRTIVTLMRALLAVGAVVAVRAVLLVRVTVPMMARVALAVSVVPSIRAVLAVALMVFITAVMVARMLVMAVIRVPWRRMDGAAAGVAPGAVARTGRVGDVTAEPAAAGSTTPA
jgi:hypothetical protein